MKQMVHATDSGSCGYDVAVAGYDGMHELCNSYALSMGHLEDSVKGLLMLTVPPGNTLLMQNGLSQS
jgi:hypothetical protein